MRPTRRFWAIAILAGSLAVLAVIVAKPIVLVGVAVLGGWLLGRQVLFLRAITTTVDHLTVIQQSPTATIRTGDTTPVTLVARLAEPSPLSLEITANLPTAAAAETPLSVVLDSGEDDATHAIDVSWPVTGRHQFEPATVTATDGYFRETVTVGDPPTVTVEPAGPHSIHVGAGGEQLATTYGEHETDKTGSGLTPAEIRKYIPGDAVNRIDWNATARLATPHVREHQAKTELRTLLVVDHRSSLATGDPGETKLDYLREVALATVQSAEENGDTIGLLTIDETGIGRQFESASSPTHYDRLRRYLLDLDAPTTPNTHQTRRRSTTSDARRILETLEDDEPFSRQLRPFYEGRRFGIRMETETLSQAVKGALDRQQGGVRTVVLTDDTEPNELRETVQIATRGAGVVAMLLAPTVLYEASEETEIDQAYDRYLAFEELRRDLARLENVSALEVGPSDQLSTVLAAAGTERGGYA